MAQAQLRHEYSYHLLLVAPSDLEGMRLGLDVLHKALVCFSHVTAYNTAVLRNYRRRFISANAIASAVIDQAPDGELW